VPYHRPTRPRDRAALRRGEVCGLAQGLTAAVVDDIVPLKRGGADVQENMQWQTREDAKAKDRGE